MPKYALSLYFARGNGYLQQLHGSDKVFVQWLGADRGYATVRQVKRGTQWRNHYTRGGVTYTSRIGLIRALVAEFKRV